MWNDMSDTAKPRSGPGEAPRDTHDISGSATTEAEQKPGADAPSDLRHDAFISYSHQDRPFALRLRTALQDHGKDVWLDESGIHPAERWKPALQRAIEGSDAFIFVMSPDSAASRECRTELDHALSLNKRVIPVVARPIDRDMLPPGLGDFQFIPARGTFETNLGASSDLLLSGIDTDLEWVREHTQWGLKAIEWDGHGRDASFLLSGSELEAAEQWLARQSGKRPEPTALDNEFVLVSRRHVVRRLRRTRAITAAALAIVSALAVTAFVLRNQAVNQSQIATSRQLAAESLLELTSDPQLSLLLGVQAAAVRHTPEALDALRRALPANHLLGTLQRGRQPVYSVALSPDGRLVAAASSDYVVRVWKTDGQLLRTLTGHLAEVLGVAFDPTSHKVLTWAEDGTARLWDLYGNRPPVVMQGGDYRVIHASISPNGQMVATSTFLHSPPRVWNATSGRFLFSLGQATDTVPDIEFSSNGSLIATANYNGTVSFWKAATGAPLGSLNVATGPNPSSRMDVNEALFSPGGRYLLVSTSDNFGNHGQWRVWDLRTLRPTTPPLTGDNGSWSPDGQFIITTGPDGNARIWDATTGRLKQLLHGPDPIAGPALLSSDGGTGSPLYAVTGSQDGTADVWAPSDGTLVESLVGTQGAVTPAAFWPDISRVVTFGSDGSTRIWSTGAVIPQSAPVAQRVLSTVRTLGRAVNVVPSSRSLDSDPLAPLAAFYNVTRSAGFPNSATVIDTRSGAKVSTFPFPAGSSVTPAGSNGYVSFDARGYMMLVVGNGRAQIRAARSGRLLHTLSGIGSLAASGAVSPDGNLVAAADNQDRIGIWNTTTGQHLVSFYRHHPQTNVATDITLKFSPDSTLVLSADQSGVTFVWQARTGRVLNEVHGPGPPNATYDPYNQGMYHQVMGGAISPNDQFVVTTSGWDNNAHVFRVGHPGELVTLQGHSDGIDDAAFSPDSTLIATTAGHSVCAGGAGIGAECDNSTRVWDIQQSSPLLTLRNDGGTRVAFSPDGTSLVINTLSVYDVRSPNGAGPSADHFPYQTLACEVCGGFDRLVPLAIHAEIRQLTPEERARFITG
jgi:WD40 repeat protein